MSGLRRRQGRRNGFRVTHLADEDDIGCLTQNIFQSTGETFGVCKDFALLDYSFVVGMNKLDRVFDGNNVA